MGCDMVVALGTATVDGRTLFGHNSDRAARQCQTVQRTVGRSFALGEKVRTQELEIPQARQTCTVLGSQPHGVWGYDHGINACQVAAGRAALRTRLQRQGPGLHGTDLVRLVLERAHSARHGVDVLIDLLERHGQDPAPRSSLEGASDNTFLIADPREAFALETSGTHWVCQEIQQVRAASNVSVVRQDWDRISHGLAGHAIAQGWWPADGSKFDFADTLSESVTGLASGLRRWGRATLLLEQQNGHIDAAFLRRLLSDHYEGMHDEVDPLSPASGPVPLCQHASRLHALATTVSSVADLGHETTRLPLLWTAFGPPCLSVYFPLFLDGDLPVPFSEGSSEASAESLWWRLYEQGQELARDREHAALARDLFARLQARFDQEADEFACEGSTLQQRGQGSDVPRLASLFMQHCLESFETALLGLTRRGASAAQRRGLHRIVRVDDSTPVFSPDY